MHCKIIYTPLKKLQEQTITKELEVGNAGLTYRQLPSPKGGNFLFHVMNGHLIRLRRESQKATKLRYDPVNSELTQSPERKITEIIFH